MSNTMNYEELKKLAAAATPGPWHVQYGDDASHMCMTAISTRNKRLNNQGCFTETEFESFIAITLHQSYPWVDPDCKNDGPNADYIAAASPDAILKLIEERNALYEALQSMLAIHTEPAGFVGKYGKKLTEFVEAQEVKVNAATAKARAALALVGGGE